MFWQGVKGVTVAVSQVLFVAVVGYYLVRRQLLGKDALNVLSRLIVEVTLPLLIFTQILSNFSFGLYRNWWVFPLLSFVISVAGFCLGGISSIFIKDALIRRQFISLVAFQNSGYLPLALSAALVPVSLRSTALIYIFLFLLGFNLIFWAWATYLLDAKGNKDKLSSLWLWFNPAVVATLVGLVVVALGIKSFLPHFVVTPLKALGECTIPLANLVVGGSIALLHPSQIKMKLLAVLGMMKLFLLPLLGMTLLTYLKVDYLLGLLIIMELAMPSATSLTVILHHTHSQDLFISQGIFWTHIMSIFTVPLFLSWYFAINMVR